jgi:hypothetical protein
MTLRLGETDSAVNAWQSHSGQAFGKDAARTFTSRAAKATDLEIELADPPVPGEIPKAANIATVNAARASPAQWACPRSGASVNGYDDAIRIDGDPINRKASREQRQQRGGQRKGSTF